MKKISLISALDSFLQPYKRNLVAATICSIANKICDVVPELLIGLAIGVIVNQEQSTVSYYTGIQDPYTQLTVIAVITAFLWIGESIFEYAYLSAWGSLAYEVQRDLRVTAYHHVQQLNASFFEEKSTGALFATLYDDIEKLEEFLRIIPNAIIQLVVNIVIMGIIFTLVSPTIAVLTFLPIPCIIVVVFYFKKKLALNYPLIRKNASSLASHLTNRLLGLSTIQSYTAEEYEKNKIAQEATAYADTLIASNRINAAYIPVVRLCVLAGFLQALVVGGWYALEGTLPISAYSILVFLSQRFLWPFTSLSTITDIYEEAHAAADRIFTLLKTETTISEGIATWSPVYTKKDITFNHISFAYNNNVPVLTNFSCTIPAQKTVAFVGGTGSGKSTLMKLIMRFYDPQEGTIMWGDSCIDSFTLSSLRNAIGLISQETYLAHGTIAETIAYGKTAPDRKEIIAAAQLAEAHEFIMKLPLGYDTIVQENGKNFSGGQRQRLSIARALFKNPALLICDEATSALDNETQMAIQQSLKKLHSKSTMVIIAHRLTTIRDADIIFVMKNGTIIESGTHEELLEKNGEYTRLWNAQHLSL